jgi:5-methylcytosine-specific restriction endonuclease McrBC regulatory subunit McrC
VDTTAAELAATDALWPLVASWYVAALEGLLRSGLASGYRDARDELMVGRGRVLAVGTARLLLKGRARLDCQYEEFDLDTPLNRVLRAAASAVAGSPALARDIRRRAKRAIDHMEGVGRLHAADVRTAWPERHTWRYAAPLQLARHVLAATGRGIDVGDEHGFAFLIRTPEMVEEALRRIAQAALGDVVTVEKRTRFLTGSAHSLTPDVSFGTQAVGDVKYKVWRGDWDRADLYQLVAFATGFDVTNAVRIGFSATAPTPAPPKPAHVQVGRVSLARCDWPFEDSLSPQDAEESLTRQLRAWWAGLPRDASQLALALAR